jgi:hypothetical protein
MYQGKPRVKTALEMLNASMALEKRLDQVCKLHSIFSINSNMKLFDIFCCNQNGKCSRKTLISLYKQTWQLNDCG